MEEAAIIYRYLQTLDGLKAEFAAIKTGKQPNVKRKNLLAFQKKLASLVFLDKKSSF